MHRGTAVTVTGSVTEFRTAAGLGQPHHDRARRVTTGSPTATGAIPPTVDRPGRPRPPTRSSTTTRPADVDIERPSPSSQRTASTSTSPWRACCVQVNDARGRPDERLRRGLRRGDHGRACPTIRGGVLSAPTDFNPERFILDDVLGLHAPARPVTWATRWPVAPSGRSTTPLRQLQVLPSRRRVRARRPPARDHPQAEHNELAWPVQRREPRPDRPRRQVRALAAGIVTNLTSPRHRRLEEIQDNNGADATTARSPPTRRCDCSSPRSWPPAARRTSGARSTRSNNRRRRRAGRQHPRRLPVPDRPRAGVRGPAGRRRRPTPVEVVAGRARGPAVAQPGPDRPGQHGVGQQPQAARRRVHVEGQDGVRRRQPLQLQGRRRPAVRRFQPPVRRTETQRHQQATECQRVRRGHPGADRDGQPRRARRHQRLRVLRDVDILEGGQLWT